MGIADKAKNTAQDLAGKAKEALGDAKNDDELKARADADMPAGLIFIPFAYAEAAANVLTNPQLDPFGKIPEFKYCAARLEPVSMPIAAE